MSTTLLATKLYIPPFRPNLVARPRLLQKLEDGLRLGRKAVLVSAPAGFGKTTLIVEWLEARRQAAGAQGPLGGQGELPAAWLSLDERDNDPATFVTYLVAALRTLQPGIGLASLQMLEGETLPALETVLLPLLNDLAAIQKAFLLVLDDYHEIHEPQLHEAMALLVERQPPQMQVVITTRQDPLLPTARWRARGWLTEIRLGDLRFSEQEAADFLNRSMGLSLQAEDIRALEGRTEGWIAGLQLAAVGLQQFNQCGDCSAAEGATAFIQAFAGNDRYVMEYLVEEVLCCQTQETQDFLLQTAILERFNASLCDAVIESQRSGLDLPRAAAFASRDSQTFLDYIDKANLFLIPLDNRREWYRYHHLFAELMRHRLEQNSAINVGGLHQRAAVWLEANGFTSEGIRHALAGRDYELAVEMIARAAGGGEQWSHGEANALIAWIRELPPEVLAAHLELEAHLGRAYYVTGRYEEMERVLDRLDARLKQEPNLGPEGRALQGEVAMNRGLFESVMGKVSRTRALAAEAIAKIPADRLYPRSRAYFTLGMAYDSELNYPQAVQAFEQALELGRAADAYFAHMATVAYLSWTLFNMGHLRRAEDVVREAIEQEAQSGGLIPLVGAAHAQLCFVLYERNLLDEAETAALASLERYSQGNIVDKYGWYHFLLAETRLARGNRAGAIEAQREAERIIERYPYGEGNLLRSREFQVRFWMQLGEEQKALQWAQDYAGVVGQPTTRFKEYADMAYVRVLAYEKRWEEALTRLERWIGEAEAGERWGTLVAWYAWRAVCLDGAGQRFQALDDLKRSLTLAAPEGYLRSILDLGKPLQALLQAYRPSLEGEGLRRHADLLLAAFPPSEEHPAIPAAPPNSNSSSNHLLVEPLTDRELEVLALLAGGLSNNDIARKLYLSTNTLKAHSQSIYSKLDVHSRIQAVNKARELGLISPEK